MLELTEEVEITRVNENIVFQTNDGIINTRPISKKGSLIHDFAFSILSKETDFQLKSIFRENNFYKYYNFTPDYYYRNTDESINIIEFGTNRSPKFQDSINVFYIKLQKYKKPSESQAGRNNIKMNYGVIIVTSNVVMKKTTLLTNKKRIHQDDLIKI